MRSFVASIPLVGPRRPDSITMAIGLAIHIFIFEMGSAYAATWLLKEKA